jgi:hypothetical protein
VLALAATLAVPVVPARAASAVPSKRPAPAEPRLALPFIENDYPRALAEARARKVPLFIEAWAPW